MRSYSLPELILPIPSRARHRSTMFIVASALLLILAGCGPESSPPDANAAGEVTVRDPSISETQPNAYAQVTVDHLPSVANASTPAPGVTFAADSTGAPQAAEAQVAAPVIDPAQAPVQIEAADYPCASSTATVAQLDDRQVTFLDGTRLALDEVERVIGEIEVASIVFLTVCTDDSGAQNTTIFVLQSPDAPPSPDNPAPGNTLVDNRVPTREIAVCHLPPGNDARRHTILISESALEAHLAHGDHPGECRGNRDTDRDNGRDDDRDDKRKATICHIPRGNPSNARTLRVGQSAVDDHLAHGDTRGACPDDDDDDDRDNKKPGRDDDDDDDHRRRNRDRDRDRDRDGDDDDDDRKNRGNDKKKERGKKKND